MERSSLGTQITSEDPATVYKATAGWIVPQAYLDDAEWFRPLAYEALMNPPAPRPITPRRHIQMAIDGWRERIALRIAPWLRYDEDY